MSPIFPNVFLKIFPKRLHYRESSAPTSEKKENSDSRNSLNIYHLLPLVTIVTSDFMMNITNIISNIHGLQQHYSLKNDIFFKMTAQKL